LDNAVECAVKKYQWHDASLKKKSQAYDWLMLGTAGVALLLRMAWADVSGWVLLGLLVGALVCFVLSWRLKNQDVKLKASSKH
jgi:hypothetical protein